MKLTVGSLFAGIGGFDLAAERAGLEVKWQVEIDDYATRVLSKHWPNVTRFRDVRKCGGRNLEWVDVICGGFPCQDISSAGQKVGIDGERSGLEDWDEFSGIWPRAGMTRSGRAYRLLSLARHISALGSSWLATPTATANQTAPSMMKHPGCRRWLPTPNTHGGKNSGRWDELGGSGNPFRGTPLASVAIQPWQYEWMMGFPIGWSDCAVSATASCRPSLSGSSPELLKPKG
jgi:hypothetical protein